MAISWKSMWCSGLWGKKNRFLILVILCLLLCNFIVYGPTRKGKRNIPEKIYVRRRSKSISAGIPETQHENISSANSDKIFPKRTILLWNDYGPIADGETRFYDCGKYQCDVTTVVDKLPISHIVIGTHISGHQFKLQPWQRFIQRLGESPKGTLRHHGHANWTFTYHLKSELNGFYGFSFPIGQYDKMPFTVFVDSPIYMEKFTKYLKSVQIDMDVLEKNKTKLLLWFVSHCGVPHRENYARAMIENGVHIDKYGKCGKKDPCYRDKQCIRKMSLQYKFYLAFENSKCEYYITEKLWQSFQNGMVPIVQGTTMKEYEELLPPDSYLHVDNFTGPADLVRYIKYLDETPKAYMRYHQWRKTHKTVLVITNQIPYLWYCDICKKINEPPKPAPKDMSNFWTRSQCKIYTGSG